MGSAQQNHGSVSRGLPSTEPHRTGSGLRAFGGMIVVLGHDLAGIGAAFGLGALLFVAVALPLHRVRLAPDWARQVAGAVGGGFSGLAASLAKLFRTDDEQG